MADKLRVLIDARMLMGRFSGVARMVTSLVGGLTRVPNLRIVALCGNEPYEPWASHNELELIVSDFTRKDRSPVRRLLWEATRLRHWIAQSGADVFHATWNTGVPFRCPIPAVLTVHDVIPWDEPALGFSARAARTCYRHSLRASMRRAQRVTAVSGFTADQIARKVGIDPSQTRVIYNGVEGAKAIVEKERSSMKPYLLYVGGYEPRKNLETVFEAVAHYGSQYDPAMELHLTGSANQLSSVARQAFEQMGQNGRIRFLGSPNDDELAQEYSSASALLMLSRAEGFGLPVIEAMAHGCPVIAARCGALPEVVGDAGVLVDPDAASLIAGFVHRIVSRPEYAKELIARGRQRAGFFTWQRAVEAYHREYQLALAGQRSSAEQSPAAKAWPIHKTVATP